MEKTVAHSIDAYMGLSQTFIYEYLTHASAFRPLVFTDRIQNRDAFPFQPIIAAERVSRYSWWWLVNGLSYRVQPDQFFEHWLYFAHKAKQYHVALIHAHFGPAGVKMILLKEKLGVPLVTTFYGFDVSRLPQDQRWRDRYLTLFERGDLFLVEGPYMQQALEQLGCPPEKIAIQRIGVDLSRYPFRLRSFQLKKEKLALLFCGRFTEKKGLLVALHAYQNIARHYPNSEFRIIGDGEQRDEVTAFIQRAGLSRKVILTGSLSHSACLQEMERAHILLQPSQLARDGDSEGGAPTVLLEAQALGLPVMTTTHADIPHCLPPDYGPFLAAEGDVAGLVRNFQRLLEDQRLCRQLAVAGRAFIMKNHDINMLAAQLERRYDRLLSGCAAD